MNLHATHHHLIHYLGCDDFDALIDRAGGVCELCDATPEPFGSRGTAGLAIDHDHERERRGERRSVRGLLCPRCNAHMRRVDAGERQPSERVLAYLASPWHKEGVA